MWEEENITKNSIIPSQSTLVTKSIFKFSYLEVLLAGPLCTAYSGTLKKDSFFHLPPVSKCHPVWKGQECLFLLLITCLSGSRSHEASWVCSERWGEADLGQGTQQAWHAGRRAGCLPHDTAAEEPLESELSAKADWKENPTKEYNKKQNWEKGGIKHFIKICNFLFSLLRQVRVC